MTPLLRLEELMNKAGVCEVKRHGSSSEMCVTASLIASGQAESGKQDRGSGEVGPPN